MALNIFGSDYGFLNRLIISLGGEKVAFYTKPDAWPFILLFFSVEGCGLWFRNVSGGNYGHRHIDIRSSGD